MAADDSIHPLQGVIPILPVPFTGTGAVDEISFRKVVDAAIGDGVHGLALFGLASEYAKLADGEKWKLTRVLVEQVADRVPVIISLTQHSLEVARREAATAVEMGVDALMVLPPFFLSPGAEAVHAHIEAIAAETDLPVIVQYAPIQTGSSITVESLVALHRRHQNLEYVKVDLVPSGPMVTSLAKAGLKAMVGYMGLHLPEDMGRGAVAVMPTVSVSKAFVGLWNLLHLNPEKGRELHAELLPLLLFMMQSVEMLVAVEKNFLFRRGLLSSDYCRSPRWIADAHHQRQIERLWSEFSGWLLKEESSSNGSL